MEKASKAIPRLLSGMVDGGETGVQKGGGCSCWEVGDEFNSEQVEFQRPQAWRYSQGGGPLKTGTRESHVPPAHPTPWAAGALLGFHR